jgi:hypothetical protein
MQTAEPGISLFFQVTPYSLASFYYLFTGPF